MTTIEQARAVEQRLRKCAVTEISPWEAADTIASLITELEAAQKGAARYRWLRDSGYMSPAEFEAQLDHAIAAIAAGGAK